MPTRKKHRDPEYRLSIRPHFNERQQRYTTMFILETTLAFAAFRYDLTVEERRENHSIHFRILGLRAPQLSLPSAGHARYVTEHEGLRGTYTVAVEGLDGTVSSWSIRIVSRRIEVLKSPRNSNVILVTKGTHSS
jgi:hypothetical protein